MEAAQHNEVEPGRPKTGELERGPQALVFVHLSDLHFRDGADPLAEREAALRDQLLKDIPHAVGLAEGKLEAVLLTGDLARSGQSSEYAAARVWLDELCHLLDLHEANTLMCPGNHDVDWGSFDVPRRTLNRSLRECPPQLLDARIDELLLDPDYVLGPIEAYQEFASRCACDVEQRLAWELEEPIKFGRGYGLAIRGASTILNSDGDDGLGTMAVHMNQMIVKEQPGVVRMLLMHHSPPFWRRPEPGPGRMGHNIVLYGHTHTPDHALGLPSCLEITAGAVHPEEHEFVIPTYNVIEVSIDEASVPEGTDRAYALVRVFRREFDRASNAFVDAGTEPTFEERVEVPRATATPEGERPPGNDGAQDGTDGAEDDATTEAAELQPPLETPVGSPDPSRRVRVVFERLGSGDRVRVLGRMGIPASEITSLAPHRQVREVARRITADGRVEQFLDAVDEIGRP